MSEPILGVVAVRGGHRTIVRVSTQTGETREQLERWATRRDAHPNAVALSFTHEIAEVEPAPAAPATVGRCAAFREVRP